MKYDALIKNLEWKACGGHPDGARQDGLAREAADAIVLLQSELTAQKAAHAKMLDFNLAAEEWQAIKPYFNIDSQTNFEMAFDVLIDRRRRLAKKIEGGA